MPLPPSKPIRYRLNEQLRSAIHCLAGLITKLPQDRQCCNLRDQEINKILLVRATFRMGDSLIQIPAISSFRKQFPTARIDFLGAPIVAALFKDLPLNNVFTITRSYPWSALHYPLLMHRLRSTGYDAAVDLSCSQSAMGAFLVGFSAARLRIGLKGKWDRWFNAIVDKPSEINKYKILPNYLASLGLKCDSTARPLILTNEEIDAGRSVLQSLTRVQKGRAIVGVFIGGRKSWGKRWPVRNFLELVTGFTLLGLAVVVFAGPDESDLLSSLRAALNFDVPIVVGQAVSKFAALLSNCDLFVTCDSGPMHLAYALGVSTVAIFNFPNFDRWAPPGDIVRIAYDSAGCSPEELLRICSEQLAVRSLYKGRSDQSACRKLS